MLLDDIGEVILPGIGQLVGADGGEREDAGAALQPDQKVVGKRVGQIAGGHFIPERFEQLGAAFGVVLNQAVPGNGRTQRAARGAGNAGDAMPGRIDVAQQRLQNAAGKGRVAAAALAGNGDGFGRLGRCSRVFFGA